MLSERVREGCARIAASARHIRIDPDAATYTSGTAGLDPALHRLDAPADEVVRYVLILDAINFGSGWFEELGTDTNRLTARLTALGTPWTAGQLRVLAAPAIADGLGLPAAHPLTALYTRALRELGGFLAGGLELSGSAQAFAARLAEGMPLFADPGFYKRAQIAANDLVLAGVARFADIDRLTVFADNLLPHVLHADGVLVYDDALVAGELDHGSPFEVELRACAVHACELLAARAGVPPRTLDNWLWHRGLQIGGRPHVCKTTAY